MVEQTHAWRDRRSTTVLDDVTHAFVQPPPTPTPMFYPPVDTDSSSSTTSGLTLQSAQRQTTVRHRTASCTSKSTMELHTDALRPISFLHNIGAQLQSIVYTTTQKRFWKIYFQCDFWCAQSCRPYIPSRFWTTDAKFDTSYQRYVATCGKFFYIGKYSLGAKLL